MQQIRSFGVLQTSKVVAIIYALVTLVFFVPFALIGLLAGAASGGQEGIFGGVAFLVLALLAPVLYGILGFIFTALSCAVYNVVAGWVGGIEVRMEGNAPPPPYGGTAPGPYAQ